MPTILFHPYEYTDTSGHSWLVVSCKLVGRNVQNKIAVDLAQYPDKLDAFLSAYTQLNAWWINAIRFEGT